MTPFLGYPGQVWATIYAALGYLTDQLETSPSLGVTEQLAGATFETLINGLAAVNANRILSAWQAELSNIQSIQALPISLDAGSATILNRRAGAYQGAISALGPLVPNAPFPTVSSTIGQGMPAIPDMSLIGFYQGFNYETPPAGLSASNFGATASSIATAFTAVANAILVLQGTNLTQAYDTATRLSLAAQAAANIVNGFTSGPISSALPVSGSWNQIVTLPAFTIDAAILGSAPYSLLSQQSCVIRNTILLASQQVALFLLNLRQPSIGQASLTTVYNGETLMDVAARALGDFEQWTAIATLNGLLPPYLGPTAGPGIIAYGSQVLLPTPGAIVAAAGNAPSYLNNFLGIDFYLGPINAPMLPWTGDFQTIAGYPNLAISLGRRLQTTLGRLLYHADYGSRIPPEVGAVQTNTTAGQIAAFGKSAILSDPRVAAVLSATSSLQPNGKVAFQGNVQPAGFGASPVTINEVLAPSP